MVNLITINFQLNKLKELLLSPDTDISWSTYESVYSIIEELNVLENGMKNMEADSF